MAAADCKLEAVNVAVVYEGNRPGTRFVALQDVNVGIGSGEFVTIVGPSGCGKTTFLNAVAGLVRITGGSLRLNRHEITAPGRDRGMVFQQPYLLPWRSVQGNIGYGLELQRVPGKTIRERVDYFIWLVGLDGFEDAYPSQLSGGMQQRCNLARALATDPEVLLLDEPFAALDAQTREFMQLELLDIWARARKTALFVTHQIDEAIYLGDRVLVMGTRPGRVIDVVTIDLPRPRPLEIKRDSQFLNYQDRIWSQVVREATKTGLRRAAYPDGAQSLDAREAVGTNTSD